MYGRGDLVLVQALVLVLVLVLILGLVLTLVLILMLLLVLQLVGATLHGALTSSHPATGNINAQARQCTYDGTCIYFWYTRQMLLICE
jgi:uncharacterized membrane protein YqiK